MPAQNILVVVVDGLRASALGAYGNTTFPTPALDRFAADSLLFDWCYANSVDLTAIYRDLWQLPSTSLLGQLRSGGYTTTLVTDDPELPSFAGTNEFDNCLHLSDKSAHAARAKDTSDTALARLFASASEVVSSTSNSPQLVWLHARGMYATWDAPLELQVSLLDEGDPPPVEEVAAPDFIIVRGGDPDAAFRYACAYAAQAMVLDECLETLLNALESTSASDPRLVTLIGARGYPLGEHGRVGGVDGRLYGEQLHVPWLIRLPNRVTRLERRSQLVSQIDLAPLLLDATARPPRRDALIATGATGHRAIRTPEWCLRLEPDSAYDAAPTAAARVESSSSNVELFVRPDDRWEANDVAKLCTEVVESLTSALDSAAPPAQPQ